MNDTEVIHETIDRGTHTVLVVDDNAATRYATARVLRAAGFHVSEAASGMEALTKAVHGVSGVVLDVHLPDIDGFQVCRELRARGLTELLPVVHLSATHVRSEDRVAGLNAGADAYLIHPVEPAVLVGTIQALIRARTAELGLRRSEQRFRAIYDQAHSGICVLDSAGLFEDANARMLQLLGMRAESLMGQPLAALACDAAGRDVADLLLRSREPWHGEFPLRASDGREVHLDWSFSAPMEGGLRIAVASDATARHELEERRRELLEREQAARAMAESHARTKDDFIAVLSHELRNPLNSIAGWVAVLQRRNPTPEAAKGLDAIDRNVKTQARIISDILDVSRINSGKLRLVPETVMPIEVVESAITSIRRAAQDRQVTLVQDLDDAGQPAWLDPSRFQQVLWNLLSNAIKFSPAGGTVTTTLRRTGERLHLAVEDRGQGIAAEFLPHLFDRFSQSDAPGNRRHGGLGLGLSIVKQLVELHGGTVTAYSAGPGLGTRMTVDIPVGIPAVQAEGGTDEIEARLGPESDGTGRPLQGLRVLVVEDDPGASEMLAMVLGDRGATVRTAQDFDSAVAAARAEWPEVVVSDIGLPGRDGYELIAQLRGMQPAATFTRLAAVSLTAFARTADRDKALAAGFDTHLAKPLKPHALVQAILDVYGKR